MRHLLSSAALLAAGAFSPAHAAVMCVGDSAELVDALAQASTNGVDDAIRLRSGEYAAPAIGFHYAPASVADIPDAISLSGSWDDACAQQRFTRAPTVLLGDGTQTIFTVADSSTAGLIEIQAIEFRGGGGTNGGLRVFNAEQVQIDGVSFRENAGTSTGAFLVGTFERFLMTNSLIAGNTGSRAGLLSLQGGGAALLGNTFADNFTGGFERALQINGTGRVLLQNNIFANAGSDAAPSIFCFPGPEVMLVNNAIDAVLCAGAFEEAPLADTPNFTDDYRLVTGNALIDAGDPVIGPFLYPWFPEYPGIDLHGSDRVIGEAIDLGASEYSETVFADSFEN